MADIRAQLGNCNTLGQLYAIINRHNLGTVCEKLPSKDVQGAKRMDFQIVDGYKINPIGTDLAIIVDWQYQQRPRF